MTNQDFTATFSVAQPADVVFAAINDPRRWWGEGIEGNSVAVGDQFIHRVEGAHWAKLEVAELVPNELVVWRVLENRFDFVEDQTEWVGTTITFELTPTAAGTEVSFMHEGLTPQDECYEVCATAWSSLMQGSLPRLIEAGAGDPYPRVFEEHRV